MPRMLRTKKYATRMRVSGAVMRRAIGRVARLSIVGSGSRPSQTAGTGKRTQIVYTRPGFTQSIVPLDAGARIAKYRLDRRLGTGGMGEVFLAHDSQLNRLIAIKFLVSP